MDTETQAPGKVGITGTGLVRVGPLMAIPEVLKSLRVDPDGLLAEFGIGAAYFAAMALRLGLGQTVLHDSRWFAAMLPAAFHLVLASFLFTFGL